MTQRVSGLALAVVSLIFGVAQCDAFAGPAYPYHASAEREARIRSGFTLVVSGMGVDQVRAILGDPDDSTALYQPVIKNPKQIGYSHWYLIQRLAGVGSAAEMAEQLVVVRFDLEMKVSRIDHWGFAQ